jgi:hypothetical protein
LDYLEIAHREIAECRIENIVVPARTVGACDIHIGAIVSDDQPVLLHRTKNFLNIRIVGSLGHIDACFQAQPRAHRQCSNRGPVRRGINVAVSRTDSSAMMKFTIRTVTRKVWRISLMVG